MSAGADRGAARDNGGGRGGRRRASALLLGASLSAPSQCPGPAAADWQQRLQQLDAGALPRVDPGWGQLAQGASPAEAAQDFAIPPGSLEAALLAFSQAVDLQLLYPADLTAGLQSPGVEGRYDPEQALQLLIAGTGLTYRFTTANTVTLGRADGAPADGAQAEGAQAEGLLRLDPVTVTGARFATPISELPSSNTILEREDLEAQPTFQRDAIGGLAKVVPGFNFTSPVGSAGALRGREASFRINNIEINQRFRPTGNAIFDVPAAAFGRVEVVRGADATFGFGASGGAVNFRTPEPVPGEMQLETTVGLSLQPTDVGDSISPELRQSVTGSLDRIDYWLEVGGEINQTLFDPDGDPLPDSDTTFPNSDVIDFNANLVFNIDDDQRLETTHFFVHTAQDPEFLAASDGDPDTGRKTSAVPFSDFADVFEDSFRRQYIGTASYENDDVWGNRFNLTLFYQDRALRQIPGELAPPLIIQVREDNRRIGGRLNIETPLPFLDDGWFAGSSVTWGGDLQRFDYDAEETLDPALPFVFTVPEATEISRAVFAQLRVPFLEDFLITRRCSLRGNRCGHRFGKPVTRLRRRLRGRRCRFRSSALQCGIGLLCDRRGRGLRQFFAGGRTCSISLGHRGFLGSRLQTISIRNLQRPISSKSGSGEAGREFRRRRPSSTANPTWQASSPSSPAQPLPRRSGDRRKSGVSRSRSIPSPGTNGASAAVFPSAMERRSWKTAIPST